MRPPIALISPNESAWSETFIRAQRELLPADVHYLYGAYLPRFRPDGRHFISDSYFREGLAYAKDRLLQRELHSTLRQRIKTYLRKHQVRAILAQYGPTGVEMQDIARELDLPLTVHFHGFDVYDQSLLEEYSGQYSALFRQAAAIVGVSRAMVARLAEMGAPPEKLHWNPCGADLEQFSPTQPAQNPLRFLAAGRFSETKAPHLTLLAFAELVKTHPDARLTMAGEGPLKGACLSLVRALKLSNHVQLPGVMPHAQIAAEMQRSRAFVQHSLTAANGDSEGTPVAIMEAGAAGLPVVATRHAGIPDVVQSGKTGLLVEEGDVSGMAAALRKLVVDGALAGKMGAAAHRRIAAEFGLRDRVARLWSIIQSTLN
ncbi:MAG: glycosyltransferase [Bacteroidota bacterium]